MPSGMSGRQLGTFHYHLIQQNTDKKKCVIADEKLAQFSLEILE